MTSGRTHTPRPIVLDYVTHARAELSSIVELGEMPAGRRRIIHILGGRFEGPLFNATILSGGADWQIVAADGTGVIDTRYTARTDDGETAFVATQGFRHGPPDVLARLAAGEAVDPAEYVFRVTAKIEVSGEQYAWMNRSVFVATAARFANSVEYDLYVVR